MVGARADAFGQEGPNRGVTTRGGVAGDGGSSRRTGGPAPEPRMAEPVFVAWRDLRFAKGRFALMGTVIVLITMLVGLLSGLTAGLGRENTSAITALPADHL